MATPKLEQFTNNAATTLNGGITNSTTSITVTSGSVFPSSGNFRVLVDSEIMICTARSTNTLTVTRGAEGTTAVSHSDGAAISHILTSGSLGRLNQDNQSLWGYSSRPPLGKIVDTDGVSALTVSSFTWVNQGTTTASDDNGTIFLEAPAASGENCRLLTKTAPSTPYSVLAGFQAMKLFESFESFFVGFRQSSSGKLHLLSFGYDGSDPAYMAIYAFDNATTFNGTVTNSTLPRTKVLITGDILWLKITDNGTNLVFNVSGDGVSFTQIASFSRTTHMTTTGPDQVCWGVNNQGSTSHKMHSRLVHWSYPDNTAPLREQYINTGETTLSASMDNSQTSLSATSGAVFPSTGNFRIKVENEIMICTARSSNTLTVTRGAEGTTAASHANGLGVTQIITADGLTRIGKDNDHFWGNTNRLPLARIVDTNGTSILTASSFSWVNQGTSTVTDENGTIVMVAPAASGENNRIQVITAPSPTYSVIAAFDCCMIGEAFGNFGIYFRQSTSGKVISLTLSFDGTGEVSPFNIAAYKFTDATTFSANLFARKRIMLRSNRIWFKITDDNTNLIFYYSFDGINWLQLTSEARGTFMTLNGGVTGPNQVGWGMNNQGSTNHSAIARLVHWSYL